MDMEVLKILISIVVVGVLGVLLHLYKVVILEPNRIRSVLRKQGIKGPPPSLLSGNLSDFVNSNVKSKPKSSSSISADGGGAEIDHNWDALLFPCFEWWRKQYGDLFMFSLGSTQILYVNKPELVHEVTTFTSIDLGKPEYHRRDYGALFGDGILSSNGPTWAYHRKVLAPELYMDKVKGMTSLFSESISMLVDTWKSKIDTEDGIADLDIVEYMRNFAGDVISRTCFGSNYARGKGIFQRLQPLQEAMKRSYIRIPGTTFLPTKRNRKVWRLEKEIHSLIVEVVKERMEKGIENDLLQKILESAKNGKMSKGEIDHFIVDNCKNIYLAGFETTALAVSWCLMLLASNPEWQTRVRDEVLQVCGGQTPNADMLQKLKLLTMVLQETLRLYPPGHVAAREALKDLTIGGIKIPKGTNIWIMLITVQTDPKIWGSDSFKFNPERFANGVTGACNLPHSFLPFGFGPRVCLGQQFGMVEMKMLLATLLSNFSFSLSPKYVHEPVVRLVIKPGNGVNLLIKKL